MDAESRDHARQRLVEGIVSRLHRATCEIEDYRTVFADLARQLLDRMDADGWRTLTRHALTAGLVADLIDGPVEGHSDDRTERRMAYADLYEKVSVSETSGVRQEHMRAEFLGRAAA